MPPKICRHDWASQIPTDPVPPAASGGTSVCEMGTGRSRGPKAPTTSRTPRPFTTFTGERSRPISRVSLRPLPGVHGLPIHPLVWWGSDGGAEAPPGIPDLGVGFALRCGQRFSAPNLASQRCIGQHNWAHQRFVHSGPLVLGVAPRKDPPLTTERDRTVSRRSEPSSRTALIGEQPNPWDRLQPQDAMSRHRGAKPSRRYGLLGKISLLSPG